MCKSEARSGFNYTTRAYRQASAHPGFWDYVGDVVRGVQCYFRIRNARRAPERLPDHALKDMGHQAYRSTRSPRAAASAIRTAPLRAAYLWHDEFSLLAPGYIPPVLRDPCSQHPDTRSSDGERLHLAVQQLS